MEGVMKNFGFRSLVCCGVAFIIALSSIAHADWLKVQDYPKKQEEVLKWVENCSDSDVSTYKSMRGDSADLVVHATNLGPEKDKFLNCLLPKVAKDLEASKESAIVVFDSPIVRRFNAAWPDPGTEKTSPDRQGYIRTDNKHIIVTSLFSSYGIEKIKHLLVLPQKSGPPL